MSFNYARTERTFFDQELKGHFDRLEGMGPDKAEVSLVSKTGMKRPGSSHLEETTGRRSTRCTTRSRTP